MTITHIVLFEFKPRIDRETVRGVCNRMLALREKCIHPTSQKPYIKSSIGGRDNSPEGHQGGFTHAFVFEFENEEDRKYYLEIDPTHQDFMASVKDLMQNVRVVDFTAGVY